MNNFENFSQNLEATKSFIKNGIRFIQWKIIQN